MNHYNSFFHCIVSYTKIILLGEIKYESNL